MDTSLHVKSNMALSMHGVHSNVKHLQIIIVKHDFFACLQVSSLTGTYKNTRESEFHENLVR